jgi:NAD(P)H-dependent FMN reductase
MSDLRVVVFGASVRDGRVGDRIVGWVADRLGDRPGALDVEVIDPAVTDLPDDRLLVPGGGSPTPVSEAIGRADGFVLVSPEYNHSYPATLKRLIDAHYREWMFKAATVVSYGVQGGLLATEHLRAVLAELHVVTTRRTVGLRCPWEQLAPEGFRPDAGTDRAFDAAADELVWWAETLHAARRDRPFTP